MQHRDYPRFQYRGLMIDVSRNFRDKNFIKKQIDAMAALWLTGCTCILPMPPAGACRSTAIRAPY